MRARAHGFLLLPCRRVRAHVFARLAKVPQSLIDSTVAAANESKEFFRMEGSGHDISGDDFYEALVRFLARTAL